MNTYLNIIRVLIIVSIGLHVYIVNHNEPQASRVLLTVCAVVLIAMYGQLHKLNSDAKN
jgi:ABC-type siderophore export system fused ATPase/permease subunit